MVAVVTLNVDDVPVAGLGANEPAAPAGSPLADKLTSPAKPPLLVIVTVYVVLVPRLIVCDAGDADSVKSGVAGALTISVTVAVCVSVPSVPEMVTG